MADGSARKPDDSPNLEQFNPLLAGIFNAASLGLVVFDAQTRIVKVNAAFAFTIANLPVSDCVGKTIHEILGRAADDLESAIRATLDTGKQHPSVDVAAKMSSSGFVNHWLFNLFPIKDQTEGRLQVAVITIETSHQKRIEQYFLTLMADMSWIRDQIAKDRSSHQDRREMLPPLAEIGLLDAVSKEAQRVSTLLRCGPTNPANGTATDNHLTAANHRDHRRTHNSTNGEPPLSPRELEVLRLIASDKVSKEIGSMLGITAKSVDTLKSRIMLKLHVHSTTALVIYAIRNHLVSLDATAGHP